MDSNIAFDIKFEASCLNPKPDKVLTGKVCMVFPDGVFIDVMKKMQILIPKQFIEGFTFNKKTNSYVKDDNDQITISEGKQLRVSITASQYSNQKFSVFGKIVE
jgi:DNA-directed RNA polymerase subunit E'/Rpb7